AAAFAGFAVMGMFTAITPALLTDIMHYDSSVLTGLIVFSMFISSVVGQRLSSKLATAWRLPAGCLIIIVGTLLIVLSIQTAWLLGLLLAGILSGLGQGMAFRGGMESVMSVSPSQQRAEVAAGFFLVAYVALSLPIIGLGLLARPLGLAGAGTL